MAGIAPVEPAPDPASSPSQAKPGERLAVRQWPAAAPGYWALCVIVLATFVNFFDQVMFGMMAERIKHDFRLTDSQLGFLAGPASILAYLFVGIPLARLADVVRRTWVLAAGSAAIGTIIALGGLAQTFGQFVLSRVFLAASASAHAPSSYSLLADAFPPRKLTRAFALLQFGFIGGTTLGPLIGGKLVMVAGQWPPTTVGPLHVFGWQWLMIWTGLPAVLVGLLFLTVKEPPRAVRPALSDPSAAPRPTFGARVLTFIGWDALKAIHAQPKVYYPLFGALALSAIDVFGLQFWRTPFMIRTYHWNEGQIGAAMGAAVLAGSLTGLLLGGLFVEWLARRHADANVRAAAIFFAGVTVCTIAAPLMPSGEAAIALMGLSVAFGIAGAVPQNAAIQRVAPDAMRGQVTAIYLFMFTFFGAMGSFFVGRVQDLVVRDESKLWLTLVICAATLLPLATLLMAAAMKPYREEVARLEALEKQV